MLTSETERKQENSWSETKSDTEKQMMRNEAENHEETDLIKEKVNSEEEHTKNETRKLGNGHVKNSNMSDQIKTQKDVNHSKAELHSSLMARLPFEQMAFKSGGFPSPQLIVIKTESIALDQFLQIRHLAISQGHYITSIIDKTGKIGGEVLQVVDRNRPHNSYYRAVRQIEHERTQTSQSQDTVPPVKSPRLHNQPDNPEVVEETINDDVEECESESDDEVNSEVSATFNRLNTSIKREPATAE